jgi:hypothetical protein
MNSTLNWYSYGHDFGNAEIGGVIAYKGQFLSCSIPTAFAKVDTSAMKSLGVEIDNAYVMRMTGEETSYAVGELALQQVCQPKLTSRTQICAMRLKPRSTENTFSLSTGRYAP